LPILKKVRESEEIEPWLRRYVQGDAAIGTVLDELEASAKAKHWRDRSTRIEHGDLIAPADIERVLDLGVVIVWDAGVVQP
jgi:predicted amidohydrolase YtcJ